MAKREFGPAGGEPFWPALFFAGIGDKGSAKCAQMRREDAVEKIYAESISLFAGWSDGRGCFGAVS